MSRFLRSVLALKGTEKERKRNGKGMEKEWKRNGKGMEKERKRNLLTKKIERFVYKLKSYKQTNHGLSA
jgi:hypothetical protein